MRRPVAALIVVVLLALALGGVGAQDADTIVIRGFGNIVTFNPTFARASAPPMNAQDPKA